MTAEQECPEIFVLAEEGSRCVLFAPRQGVLLRTTAGGVNLLSRVLNAEATPAETSAPLVSALQSAGVLGPQQWNPSVPVGIEYFPTRVVLLLTTRCNLACRYCYAGNNGAGPQTMPVNVGEAAIDFAAENCEKKNREKLSVAFHGGGEPTQAWNEMVRLVEHAEVVAKTKGLKLELGLATNGCMSEDRMDWVVSHFSHVNVSFDGPPDIHDNQRSMRNGHGSCETVLRFMRRLDDAKKPYGIQATVTAVTVNRLSEIVRYVARNTKVRFLKFEPVCRCGRFAENPSDVPGAEEFVREFNAAFDEGWRLGIGVAFAGVRLFAGVLTTFCGAFSDPFSITPDGHISACFEVFNAECEYASVFLLGRYDKSRGGFVVDWAKLRDLRGRNVTVLGHCRYCFCKYMCAGDCATRTFRHYGQADLHAAGGRCEIVRGIARHQLMHFLDAHITKESEIACNRREVSQ